MTGTETHRYALALKAGEFFQARAEQKGVDVTLRLLDASGNVLGEMDSPNGKQGPETISFVAEKAGSFMLEVSGLDAKAERGGYTIRREASRTATAKDRRRVEVERLFVEGMAASHKAGESDTAIAKLEGASAGWRELGEGGLVELTTQKVRQVKVNKYDALLFTEPSQELKKAIQVLGEGQKLSVRSKSDSLAAREKLNESLTRFRALNAKLKDTALVEKIGRTGEVSRQLLNLLKLLELQAKNGEAISLGGIAQTHNNLGELRANVDYQKQALAVYREILEDKAFADLNIPGVKQALIALKTLRADTLADIGGTLDNSFGQPEEALKYLNESLERRRALYQETQGPEFKLREALTLQRIGTVYSREAKDSAKALESFTESLKIYGAFENEKRNVATALTSIAMVQSRNYEYEAALKNLERALEINREMDDKFGQSSTLYIMASMYWVLNDKVRLKERVDQSLAILQSPDFAENAKKNANIGGLGVFDEGYETFIEKVRLDSIAYNYRMMEDYPKSLEYYEKVLALSHSMKEPRTIRLSAASVAYTLAKLEEWDKASEYYKQALEISRTGNVNEDTADDLTDVGWTLMEAGKAQEALKYQNEALALYQSVGIGGKEAFSPKYSSLLTELARTHDALGNRRLAIFYGKRAINEIQSERQRLQNLDAISRKGFLEKKEKHYRRLADWLIAEGRIAEAEQVLALLKGDELFEYLRRGDKVAKELLDKIPLNDPEREAYQRYQQIADRITLVGKEHDELEKASRQYEVGKFPQQARLDDLGNKLTDARKVFNRFFEELSGQYFNKEKRQEDVRVAQISGTQALLSGLKQPRTVILSTIAGEDRLNIIVTTAKVNRAHTVDIKAEELNKLVAEFRAAAQDPSLDPRPAGKKLYDKLLPPALQKDLEGVKADTIVWSLDGTLRYAPLAALWDGKRYLAEKYSNSVITLASLDKLKDAPGGRGDWTALGVGVSKPFGGFSALPSVPVELCSVVDDPQKRAFCAELTEGKSGIIRGVNLPDEEFTLRAFKLHLGRYSIVHVASHFSLNAGNEASSYLLLGGGKEEERRLSLAAVRDEIGDKFSEVELLTLSACNTAMSAGEKSSGAEIESFGAIAQKQGAKSVLATLWSVADASTRVLMSEFYGQLEAAPRVGKGEALRKAQLSLINGRYRAGETPLWRGPAVTGPGADQSPPFTQDKGAPFTHPYYWSPFVLTGNWR
ncbi:MAG TPA: CHAT domain-containing protein [Blastocatellia bacterium]|nr:CHAT domain-containing protein [Blastocatellia bacterium]